MGRIAHVFLSFSLMTSSAAVTAGAGTSSNSRMQWFDHDASAGLASAVPADSGFDKEVWGITTYNGDLVVGGSFFNSPDGFTMRVAGFDGSGWYAINGIPNGNPVYDLYVHNGELYAGYALPRLNKWDGNSWTELQPVLGLGIQGSIWALTTYNNQLIVGGSFDSDVDLPSYIARWNGAGWDSLGSEIAGSVQELIVFDGELIAGGFFSTGGGSAVNRIARWTGSSWSTLGGGITGGSGGIRVMTIYNNELIAGGNFTTIGGNSASNIARWNGSTWQPLGLGLDGQVYALTVHDGKLIAGGLFQNSGATPMPYVASWNGSTWSPVGTEIDNRVNALGVYNGYLIAGGRFTTAGDGYVALWDNLNWRPVLDIATDIDKDGETLRPTAFSLDQNYPNPFNPTTTIRYSLTEPGHVEIEVFSILGQRVRRLTDQSMPAGDHEIRWDGTGDDGQRLASGSYFYRLRVGDRTETRKLLLLK